MSIPMGTIVAPSTESPGSERVIVRWQKPGTDRINAFRRRRDAEDFAHRMGECGYSITIGTTAQVMAEMDAEKAGAR